MILADMMLLQFWYGCARYPSLSSTENISQKIMFKGESTDEHFNELRNIFKIGFYGGLDENESDTHTTLLLVLTLPFTACYHLSTFLVSACIWIYQTPSTLMNKNKQESLIGEHRGRIGHTVEGTSPKSTFKSRRESVGAFISNLAYYLLWSWGGYGAQCFVLASMIINHQLYTSLLFRKTAKEFFLGLIFCDLLFVRESVYVPVTAVTLPSTFHQQSQQDRTVTTPYHSHNDDGIESSDKQQTSKPRAESMSGDELTVDSYLLRHASNSQHSDPTAEVMAPRNNHSSKQQPYSSSAMGSVLEGQEMSESTEDKVRMAVTMTLSNPTDMDQSDGTNANDRDVSTDDDAMSGANILDDLLQHEIELKTLSNKGQQNEPYNPFIDELVAENDEEDEQDDTSAAESSSTLSVKITVVDKPDSVPPKEKSDEEKVEPILLTDDTQDVRVPAVDRIPAETDRELQEIDRIIEASISPSRSSHGHEPSVMFLSLKPKIEDESAQDPNAYFFSPEDDANEVEPNPPKIGILKRMPSPLKSRPTGTNDAETPKEDDIILDDPTHNGTIHFKKMVEKARGKYSRRRGGLAPSTLSGKAFKYILKHCQGRLFFISSRRAFGWEIKRACKMEYIAASSTSVVQAGNNDVVETSKKQSLTKKLQEKRRKRKERKDNMKQIQKELETLDALDTPISLELVVSLDDDDAESVDDYDPKFLMESDDERDGDDGSTTDRSIGSTANGSIGSTSTMSHSLGEIEIQNDGYYQFELPTFATELRNRVMGEPTVAKGDHGIKQRYRSAEHSSSYSVDESRSDVNSKV